MSLFRKKKDYFFESFKELGEYSKKAMDTLSEGLLNFDNEKLVVLKNDVHKIEHEADQKKHVIEEKLAQEFITPIDREDIFLLLDKIDDLTDSIDEISYKLYIRNYSELPKNIKPFIEYAKEAVNSLLKLLSNLDNLTNKKVLDPYIEEVLNVEEAVDKLYEENVRDLYKDESLDQKHLFMEEKVYSYFEYVTDKCRDIVKAVQLIIYKNL